MDKQLHCSKIILTTLFSFFICLSYSQVIVNSLEELNPYLDDDNVNIKLAPGIYTITGGDVSSGKIGKYWEGKEHLNNSFNLFLFEGNNSTYDFTDVTINVKTVNEFFVLNFYVLV